MSDNRRCFFAFQLLACREDALWLSFVETLPDFLLFSVPCTNWFLIVQATSNSNTKNIRYRKFHKSCFKSDKSFSFKTRFSCSSLTFAKIYSIMTELAKFCTNLGYTVLLIFELHLGTFFAAGFVKFCLWIKHVNTPHRIHRYYKFCQEGSVHLYTA